MTKTDKIRELARKMVEFADRADRLYGTEDAELLVSVGDDTFIVDGGSEDDKNFFFYFDARNVIEET